MFIKLKITDISIIIKANKINLKQSETTEKSLNTLENIRVEIVTFIHYKLNL